MRIVTMGMQTFSFFGSLVSIGFLYLPWIPFVINQFIASHESWIYPVDLQLFLSALGNLFTSYEGTPPSLWKVTAIFSLLLLYLFYKAYKTTKDVAKFFLIWVFTPLIIILFASLFKPLFVNRYLIFITIPECFLVAIGLKSLRGKLAYIFTTVFILFLFLASFVFPTFKGKYNSRHLFQTLGGETKSDTLIYVDALLYFDALYYYPQREALRVYHPSGTKISSYVGLVLIPSEIITQEFSRITPYVYIDGSGKVTGSKTTTL